MESSQQQAIVFRTDVGETIRAVDGICWRHLECRPCHTFSDRQAAEAIDVVIIPVVPSGHRNSKRARKDPQVALVASLPTPSAHAPSDSTAQCPSGDSVDVIRVGLLNACSAAQKALEATGCRATTDSCPKQTPGAKYNTWENRGVPLRVEVGAREVDSGTFCLAVHPCWAHLLPVVAQAAAAAASAAASGPETGGRTGGGHPTEVSSGATEVLQEPSRAPPNHHSSGNAPQNGPAPKVNLRLPGLDRVSLVAACNALLQAATQPASDAAVPVGASSGTGTGAGTGTRSRAALAPADHRPAGRRWCRKLHLWPDQLAAWGSTASAVAALLAALSASTDGHASGGPGGGRQAGRGLPHPETGPLPRKAPAEAKAEDAACDVKDEDRRCAVGSAHSSGELPGHEVSGALALTERPCVTHLRHLLRLGRPCHCGRGHCSLAELQREVERRCAEEKGQQVVEWVLAGGEGKGGGRGLSGRDSPQQREQSHQQQDSARKREQRLRCAGRNPRGPGLQGLAGVAGEVVDDVKVEEKDVAGGQYPPGEDDSDSDHTEALPGDRVVLLVGNIPPEVKAGVVVVELTKAFGPFGCLCVSLSRTRSGGSHGWARVVLGGSGAVAAAAAAVEQLDGALHLGGAPLSVSHSAGRLDTIFPYLPYVVRSALRVDSAAAYSATDQATADKMTDLLAGLAERLLLPGLAPTLRFEVPSSAVSPAQPQQQPQAKDRSNLQIGTGFDPAEEDGVQQEGAVRDMRGVGGTGFGALLPLTVTDGTACCGGNTLSFARRFRRVVAVELDEDRAEDLRHNAALVRAWSSFRNAHRAPLAPAPRPREQQHPREVGDGSAPISGVLRSPVHLTGVPMRAADASPPRAPTTTGNECTAADAGRGAAPPPPERAPQASAGDAARQLAPHAGTDNLSAPGLLGGPQDGAMGEVEVLCGDYTGLMASLSQDIVFVDPPWGGPQYCGALQAPSAPGCAPKPEYGDTAFMLGSTPLSYLISELLAGGGARLVAVKLPSRADMELRAMQARVRQLVLERMSARRHRGSAGGTEGPGGGADGCASSTDAVAAGNGQQEAGTGERGQDGPDDWPAQAGGELAEAERLLGAEITLGRSALIVFLLVRGGASAASSRISEAGHAVGTGAAGLTRSGGKGSGFRSVLRECCMAGNLPYRVICD